MDKTRTAVTPSLRFYEGRFFFVFSAFTYKLQILKINTCLRVLHKHPKENYLQIIHLATPSFSTLPTIVTVQSLNFHSWVSCVSATDSRSNNAYHLNTLPTIKCLYQTLFYIQEKLKRRVQKNPCQTRFMASLSWDHTITLKLTQKQSSEYSLNTDDGILVPTQISRKTDQNFTPDI